MKKKFNIRKKILALTLTAITTFSTIVGILPRETVNASSASSGTYYGINWNMDASGNLTLSGGTCTNKGGTKWNALDVKTVKCDGEIICNSHFCSMLFHQNTNLVSADLSSFNTSNATNMSTMFYYCENLTSLDVSNFDTSNVIYMGSMFYNCKNLTSLDLSNFNTSNVTTMGAMFSGCSSLTSLDLSSFDTSNVTDMNGMFYGCSALTSLNISNFDTSNVTNMSAMLGRCEALTSLDLSNFNTSNVTNMCGMFETSRSLTSLDLSSFDTSNVKYAAAMFNNCTSLTTLDLSSFDGSKLSTAMMLADCPNLEVIKTFKVLPKAKENKIWFTNTMYDTSDGTAHTSMDVANATLTKTKPTIHGVYYGINWTLDAEGNLTLQGGTCTNTQGTKWNNKDVKTVKCDGEIICNDYFCTGLFKNNTNLVSADLSGFNTSKVTTMGSMFSNCTSLTTLDLSNFNTSKVTNMDHMFFYCTRLTTLDLSSFDTSNVTLMDRMFSGCSALTSLDVSHFNTSNVTDMKNMFFGCSALTSLDVSHFNTNNVTNMDSMFSGCSALTSLDLSSFDGSKVFDPYNTLAACPNLEVIKTFKVLPQGIKIQFTNTMYDTSDGTPHTKMDVANATLTKTKHTHSYDDGIIIKQATPYNAGIRQKQCSCGHIYTETIPQLKFNIFVDKTTRIKGIAKGNTLLFNNSSENAPFIIN